MASFREWMEAKKKEEESTGEMNFRKWMQQKGETTASAAPQPSTDRVTPNQSARITQSHGERFERQETEAALKKQTSGSAIKLPDGLSEIAKTKQTPAQAAVTAADLESKLGQYSATMDNTERNMGALLPGLDYAKSAVDSAQTEWDKYERKLTLLDEKLSDKNLPVKEHNDIVKEYNALLPYAQQAAKRLDNEISTYNSLSGQARQMQSQYNSALLQYQQALPEYEALSSRGKIDAEAMTREADKLVAEVKKLDRLANDRDELRVNRGMTPEEVGAWQQETFNLRTEIQEKTARAKELYNQSDAAQKRYGQYQYNQLLANAENFSDPNWKKLSATNKDMMGGEAKYEKGVVNYGKQDIDYAIINGDADTLNVWNGNNPIAVSKSYLTQMTDRERAAYNYLYAKKGKNAADAFLEKLTPELNARQRGENQKKWEAYAEEDPWGTSAFSVLVSPAKAVSFFGQALDLIADGKIDQNAAYNQYSQIPSDIRGTVSKIAEEKWGKEGSFGYQTAMSMADFLFNSLITGEFFGAGSDLSGLASMFRPSLLIMGTGAAADTVIDLRDKGLDSTRAFVLGAAAGLAEMITEKYSLETWLSPELWADGLVKYWLKNKAAEASEEVASTVLNWAADFLYDLVSGQNENEWRRDIRANIKSGMSVRDATMAVVQDRIEGVAQDALGGWISGGVMAGVGGGYHTLMNTNVAQAAQSAVAATRQDLREANAPMEAAPAPMESAPVETPIQEATPRTALEAAVDKLQAGEQLTQNDAKRILKDPASVQALQEAGVMTETIHNDSEGRQLVRQLVEQYAATEANNRVAETNIAQEAPQAAQETQEEQAADITPAEEAPRTQGLRLPTAQETLTPAPQKVNLLAQNRTEVTNNGQTEAPAPAPEAGTVRNAPAAAEPAGRQSTRGDGGRGSGLGRFLVQSFRENYKGARAQQQQRNRANALRAEAEARGDLTYFSGDQITPDGSSEQLGAYAPENMQDDELKQTVKEYADKGVEFVPIFGQIGMKDGTRARAYVSNDGKKMWVQIDHPRLSWQQLAAHEELHRELKVNPALREEIIRDLKSDPEIAKNYDKILRRYVEMYNKMGITDAAKVEEEMLADYRAGFDMLKDTIGSGVMRAKMQESILGTEKRVSEDGKTAVVGGVAMATDVADTLTESPAPKDYQGATSIDTLPDWAKNYAKIGGENAQEVIDALQRFTDQMVANEAIYGYVPNGKVAYDKAGPLRNNREYVVTFDMDASCPRTFQFTNYRNRLQAIAGRPLTYNESIQLVELMRAYGQQIPCSYCYVENKRVLLSSSYLNWFNYRSNVLAADTDEDARAKMYSYKNGVLSNGAEKQLAEWRSGDRSYRPSAVDVWRATQTARNSVYNYLDQLSQAGMLKSTKPTALAKRVLEHFNVTGKDASAEIRDYVKAWAYDYDSNTPHLYQIPNDPDVSDIDTKALELHRTAMRYANSASSARTVDNYAPYTDQLKKLTAEQKRRIMAQGGIRKHSSNDFRMDYVQDYFLFFADLAAGGWTGHTYTKNADYVKIFGRTGDRINMSIAYNEDGGRLSSNDQEGMNWKTAQELREAYGDNVGVMAMVTSDAQLSHALNSDWIDMIIPFHHSGLDKAVWYNLRAWTDYTAKQNERWPNQARMRAELEEAGVTVDKDASAESIRELYEDTFDIVKVYNENGERVKPHFLPGSVTINGQTIPGHNNDLQTYLKLCKQYGVTPRFQGILVNDGNGNQIDVTEHPNYMKLIKETARAEKKQEPIKFNFDQYDEYLGKSPFDYAMQRMEEEAKIGGYANTAEDPYHIVDEFAREYLGKNKPLTDNLDEMLTERARDYREQIAEMQAEEESRQAEIVRESLAEGEGMASLDFTSQNLPRSFVDYGDKNERYLRTKSAMDEQIAAGKTIVITKADVAKYADATDWENMSVAREYVEGLLEDVLGESVELTIGDGTLTAYLTRDGINHFVKYVDSEKAAAAEKFQEVITNARYAYSAIRDHGKKSAKVWDYFVCPMAVEGQDRVVPFLLSVRSMDYDLRAQIYGMGFNPRTQKKTEAAIPHEDVLQENAARRSNYRESTASVEERIAQNAAEVNSKQGDTSLETMPSESLVLRPPTERGRGRSPKKKVSRVRTHAFELGGLYNEVEAQMAENQPSEFTYDPVSEQKSMREALGRLKKDFAGEAEKLSTADQWGGSDLDTAMGILYQYRQIGRETGDYSQFNEWSHLIQQKGTKGGQFVQAFAKYSRTATGVAQKAAEDLRESAGRLTPAQQKRVEGHVNDFMRAVDDFAEEAARSAVENAKGGKEGLKLPSADTVAAKQIERLKNRVQQLRDEKSALQKELNTAQQKNGRLDSTNQFLKDKLAEKNRQLKEAEKELDKARKQADRLGRRLGDVADELEGEKQRRKDAEHILQEIYKQFSKEYARDHGAPVEDWVKLTGDQLAERLSTKLNSYRSGNAQRTTMQTILSDLIKFAEEHMPDRTAATTPRTAIERISDYMNNREAYAAAWNEAKQVLREMYADDKKKLAALDAYLNSTLSYNAGATDAVMFRAILESADALGLSKKDILNLTAAGLTAGTIDRIADEFIDRVGTDDGTLRDTVTRYITNLVIADNQEGRLGRMEQSAAKELDIKLQNLLRESRQTKSDAANRIAQYLINDLGVSGVDAAIAANHIASDYMRRIEDRAGRELEKMFAEKGEKVKPEKRDKLMDLIHLGGLTNANVEDAVVDALGLNKVSRAQQRQIMDAMAQFADTLDAIENDDLEGLRQLIRLQAAARGTRLSSLTEEILSGETDAEYLRNFATTQLGLIAADFDVRSAGEKISTLQVISHLLNARTAMRNVTSNQIFDIVDSTANNVGLLSDIIMSKITGQRTVGFEKSWASQAKRQGAMKGMGRSILEVALDVDPEGRNKSKYGTGGRRTFSMASSGTVGKILSKAEEIMGYELNTTDEFHKGSVYAETLESLGRFVDAGYMTEEEAAEFAAQEALYRSFQDDTKVGAMLAGLKDVLNIIGTGKTNGKTIRGLPVHDFGLGDLVVKYTQVPGALIHRAIEYSPVGYLKAIYNIAQLANAKTKGESTIKQQRNAALSLGRATTGSGLIMAFTLLAKLGLLRRGDDEKDKNAATLKNSQGLSGTQLNVSALGRLLGGEAPELREGDILYDIGFLEPLDSLMTIAALINNDPEIKNLNLYEMFRSAETAKALVGKSLQGIWLALEDTSAMQTLSNIYSTIRYHDEENDLPLYMQIPMEIASSSVSGFIPAPIRQIAQATDTTYRDQYRSQDLLKQTGARVANAIPGLRKQLAPKLTPLGEDKTYQEPWLNALNALINPGNISVYQTDKTRDELLRVYEETGDGSMLPARNAPYSINIGGESYTLTPDERTKYQRIRGQAETEFVKDLQTAYWYREADANTQASFLNSARNIANDIAKVQWAAERGIKYHDTEYREYLKMLDNGDSYANVIREANEKLADMVWAGIPRPVWDNAKADFNDIANSDISSYEKGVQQRALISDLDLDDEQKLTLYGDLANADSRIEQFRTVMDTGLSFNETARIFDKYSEFKSEDDTRAAQDAKDFALWVDQQKDLTEKQRKVIKEQFKYWTMIPAEAKLYEKYVGMGYEPEVASRIDSALSGLQPLPGNDGVTNMQRAQAALGALGKNASQSDQMKIVENFYGGSTTDKDGSLSQWGQIKKVTGSGVTVEKTLKMIEDGTLSPYCKWMDSDSKKKGIQSSTYIAYVNKYNNTSSTRDPVTNKEIKGETRKDKMMDYINGLTNLSTEQKDSLFLEYYAESTLKDTPWHKGGGSGTGKTYAPAKLRLPTTAERRAPIQQKRLQLK